jgi:hypothetical protein
MSRSPSAADFSALPLAEVARLAEAVKLPPVETWNPARCGDSAMRIAREGTWFHEGSPIGRPAMVRLFSTILRREPDGGFVLVTPAEKLDIEVEDAPFVAVEAKSEGEGPGRTLAFRLNTGDVVVAGPDHPIRFDGDSHFSARPGQVDSGPRKSDCPHRCPRPYLHVRGGLEALIARPVYYELAELALVEGGEPPGLWSGGAFFAMAPGR